MLASLNPPAEQEKKLSPKQLLAVVELAKGTSIQKTADSVGVNEKTVDIWKKQPAFLAAIREAEDDIYNESLRILKRTMKAAINCLIRNMDPSLPGYVQVAAASKLIEQAIESHKLAELESLLVELERRVKG